jgi:hypothetical protein
MRVIPSTETKETVKTVVIAVLVTAIVAFIGGVKYEQGQTQHVTQAVQGVLAAQKSKE